LIPYIIPSVNSQLKLERHCPNCHRFGGNIHSGIKYRSISDIRLKTIPQRRMKCPFCGTTWTVRASGVADGRQRTDRLIAVGVVLYMFGLSYRFVEKFLPLLDCKAGKSSIERDVADAGHRAKALHFGAPRMRVRILGVDGTGAKMAGKNAGMLFFADIERAKLVCVEPVDEKDLAKVRSHVQKVMLRVQAEQLRTDELHVYDKIVPDGFHKICLAHWRKSKGKRAYELYRQLKAEGTEFEADDMRRLLEFLRVEPRPAKLPENIEKLVRRYINCRRGTLWKVNQLLQHIERTWEDVSNDFGDRTNNTTERIIGLDYKIRAKTMRGFKALGKAVNHSYLSEYLRGVGGICDLRKVV